MASTSRRPAAEPHLSARVLSFRDAALRGWQGRALQESSVGGGIQPIGCNSGGQLGRPYSGNSLSAAPEATHRLTRETLRRPTTAMWMLHVVAIVGFEGDEMALEGEWSAEDASRELQNVGEGLWRRGFGRGGAGNRGGGAMFVNDAVSCTGLLRHLHRWRLPVNTFVPAGKHRAGRCVKAYGDRQHPPGTNRY